MCIHTHPDNGECLPPLPLRPFYCENELNLQTENKRYKPKPAAAAISILEWIVLMTTDKMAYHVFRI